MATVHVKNIYQEPKIDFHLVQAHSHCIEQRHLLTPLTPEFGVLRHNIFFLNQKLLVNVNQFTCTSQAECTDQLFILNKKFPDLQWRKANTSSNWLGCIVGNHRIIRVLDVLILWYNTAITNQNSITHYWKLDSV